MTNDLLRQWSAASGNHAKARCQACQTYIASLRAEKRTLEARLDGVQSRYHRLLLSALKSVRSADGDSGTVYFSDGLSSSVDLLQQLAEAGLMELLGGGPRDHLFGRLTAKGLKIKEGEK
ncbi:MAG: hypothetical protein LBV79_12515 [Candidatus Adiutrix sp.]|jgi:hypothetical protein|nr:hypothetical protein [Candidatus Adiutrix sp.]